MTEAIDLDTDLFTDLEPAKIIWQGGVPESAHYGDIYFSRQNGIAETEHNFINGNELPSRLAKAGTADAGKPFVVGETGFGTGLNFLCLWRLWDKLPSPKGEPKADLHFVSTELHPLTPEDLAKAHQAWPELKLYAAALQQAYPSAISGAHRRLFADGHIVVDFLFGDAAQQLNAYHPLGGIEVNAWFLDGFSPDCNAAMWSADLYRAIATLSAPKASFATFTVAGHVRKGLAEVGFDIDKKPGYGKKRDMCCGIFQPSQPSQPVPSPAKHNPKSALVIGAGLAGIMSASHLVRQGYQVTLLEAGGDICQAASGNPASAFTPFYQKDWSPRSRMLSAGQGSMLNLLAYLTAQGHPLIGQIVGQQAGIVMLDMGNHSERAARFSQWQNALTLPTKIRQTLSADEASDIAGVNLPYGGWFYPQAGWLNLPSIGKALLAEAGDRIELKCNQTVSALAQNKNGWLASTSQGEDFSACVVVLATAHMAIKFLPELKLTAVHGQSLQFKAPPSLHGLKRALNAGHALLPLNDGRVSWGASFRHKINHADVLPEETERLKEDFKTMFDFLPAADRDAAFEQAPTVWAGLRCTHPSRLPLIGPVEGRSGLYVNLAHGARGSLSACLPFGSAAYETL